MFGFSATAGFGGFAAGLGLGAGGGLSDSEDIEVAERGLGVGLSTFGTISSSSPITLIDRRFLINSGISSSFVSLLLSMGVRFVFLSWFNQGAACLSSLSASCCCCRLLSKSSSAREFICCLRFKISFISIPPVEGGGDFVFFFGGDSVFLSFFLGDFAC